MKIIIVGGGIAGLSTYLHLRKFLPNFDSQTVIIYESHKPRTGIPTSESEPGLTNLEDLSSSTAIVGGGLGLSPNGARILKNIDENLSEAVKAQGFVCETYTFKTARGHYLAKQPTTDKKSPPEFTVSTSRHGLWECLHKAVGEGKIQYRKVVDVDVSAPKPIVKFSDGEEEEADLVIGADGVRSAVKKGIFGAENETTYAPHYEEFCGIGSFVDMDIPQELIDDKSMVFTFGPTGFFGYSPAGPPSGRSLLWWSNWETPAVPDRTAIDTADIKRQLIERHGTWADPIIQDILQNVTVDSIYPIWTTPDLPHWGETGAVLIGDAAHALQPTTGQGSSQALEDSQTLALLLAHYLPRAEDPNDELTTADAIKLTAKGLYEIRRPRVARIKARGRTLDKTKKSVNIVLEYSLYAFMWLLTNVPALGKLVLGDVIKDLYGWSAEEEVKKYVAKSP